MNFKIIVTVLAGIFAILTIAEAGSEAKFFDGGLLTTIHEYPFLTAVLKLEAPDIYLQACSGAIIHSKAVLSAAHCFRNSPEIYRIRVGSSFANSEGTVYNVENYLNHPEFNWMLFDNDISILWIASTVLYGDGVQQGAIAGPNYHVRDNSILWIAGWGRWQGQNAHPVQLRHNYQWMMNHNVCKDYYAELINMEITDNMVCGSWFETATKATTECSDDAGGPVLHFNENHQRYVIVGVTAFNNECNRVRYPGVSTRVPRYTSWISDHISTRVYL